MQTIITNWSFHPAGQGCFYTGTIKGRNDESFVMVYDCGSTKRSAYLRDSIKEFKESLILNYNNTINLLVLSHLDADHVNQVKYLLENVHCKKVVLPYLTDLERLHLYFASGYNDSTDSENYASFLADPSNYLSEFGIEEIIYIDGNDDEGNPDNGRPEPESPVGESQIKDSFVEKWSFSSETFGTKTVTNSKNSNSTTITTIKGNSCFFVGTIWQFYFYNLKQTDLDVALFRSLMDKSFGTKIAGEDISSADFRKIFSNDRHRRALKRLYKKIFSNTNTTSLLLLHFPINHKAVRSTRPSVLPFAFTNQNTLLNGDCTLTPTFYPAYIASHLSDIRVFQVPHHGSEGSWDASALNDLTNAEMIVNHSYGNKKHPNAKVVADIAIRYPSWRLFSNTEHQGYYYHIIYYFK